MPLNKHFGLLFILVCCFFNKELQAQSPPKVCQTSCKWSITGGIGISEYAGHIGVGFFNFDLKNHPIGINSTNLVGTNSPGITFGAINKYHNENFDWSLRAYHGEWGYYNGADSSNHFHHNVSGVEFTPRWKFWPSGPWVRFTPYLTFGIGLRRVQTFPETPFFGIFGKDKEGIYEINLPAGVGFNLKITKRIALNVQSNIAWTSNKNNSFIGSPTRNWLWNQAFGLTLSLCRDKVNRCYSF